MAVRALGAGRLTEEERKADRKTLRNYDLCALGERAVYLPGGLLPRRRYLLWSEIARIYKRVAVSPATGKAFLTPVLYIVFDYGGGQEEAVRFRYVHDADRMFEDIREHHPEISLMSRKGEEEKAEKERKERELLERPLMPEAEKTRGGDVSRKETGALAASCRLRREKEEGGCGPAVGPAHRPRAVSGRLRGRGIWFFRAPDRRRRTGVSLASWGHRVHVRDDQQPDPSCAGVEPESGGEGVGPCA